jgi:hypothetical protein
MNKANLEALIWFISGCVVTILLYPQEEYESNIEVVTEVKTDTVYNESVDTVYIPKKEIKTEFLRDTVLVDYKPTISSFETTFPFEYGSTKVSGEVLGEVLKMTATNDYKIPVVTNTITETRTETIVKKPKGIYVGAAVNSLLEPSASVSYLDNKYLFSYQYQPFSRSHQIGISKKLF